MEHILFFKRGWFNALKVIAVALSIAFIVGSPSHAVTGINEQINYQARLFTSTGAVVPDGTYNIEFKIYQDGDGCEVSGTSPCNGTLKWTETRTGVNQVTVTNGYLSVQLGSVTAFASSVDWNQSVLWLSINIGGTGAPVWDGEMTPFRRMAAAPYALNAKKLGGVDAANFVQIAPAAAQVDTSLLSTLFLNKTGASGNIVQLQDSGSDVLVVNNAGATTLGNNTLNTPLTLDSGTGAINIGAGAQARSVNVGTGAAAQTVTVGSTNGASVLALNAGSGNATLNATSGTVTIQTTTSGQINIQPGGSSNIVLGTSNTTGTLLVLDDKSDAGDPTGVNGGMYYSSSRKSFRCFEDGLWFNCRESSKSVYRVFTEILSQADEGVFGTFTDGSGSNAYQVGIVNHPGIMRHGTATSATGGGGIGTKANNDYIVLGNGDTWRYDTMIRIPVLSTAAQTFFVRAGFSNGNVFADPTDGCIFKYSHGNNSGFWQGVCIDAGTATCNTAIAPVANQWVRLTVVVTGSVADFRINGTSACTISTQIPVTNGSAVGANTTIRKTVGTTQVFLDTDYVELTGDLLRTVP